MQQAKRLDYSNMAGKISVRTVTDFTETYFSGGSAVLICTIF